MDDGSCESEPQDGSPVIRDLGADEEMGDSDKAGALAIPSNRDQLQCIRASDDNQVAVAGFSNNISEQMVVDKRKSQVIIEGSDFTGAKVGQRTMIEKQQNFSHSKVTINNHNHHHHHYYGPMSGPDFSSKSITHKTSSFEAIQETPITELEPLQQSSGIEYDVLNPSKGWIPLSEHVTFYNKQPIREGTKVFRGKQRHVTDQSRDIAVKLLPYNQKNSKEVDFLLKLGSHPNVVQIYESGVCPWPTQSFIAMELCCQNLHDFTDENCGKPFNFMKIASFGKQLVVGLAFIHKNNVVHGDLKPENVLISSCKNYIKLSDFGLSRDIPDNRSRTSTRSSVAGTDGYRAPELYECNPKVSCSSDMFSLGLVFHFLFTNGKHPFGANPFDWSYNIRNNQNRDLSQIQCLNFPSTCKESQLLNLLEGVLNHASKSRPTVEQVYMDAFFKDIPATLDDIVGNINRVRVETCGKSQNSFSDAKSPGHPEFDPFALGNPHYDPFDRNGVSPFKCFEPRRSASAKTTTDQRTTALQSPHVLDLNSFNGFWAMSSQSHTTVHIADSTVNVANVEVHPGSSRRSHGHMGNHD